MSLLERLGDRLRSAADDLPVPELTAAADRLRVATELLAWVRQESSQPLAVPTLMVAVEHLEHAVRALFTAREQVEAYLGVIGLGGVTAGPPPEERPVAVPRPPEEREPDGREPVAPLRRWWSERVDALTGYAGAEAPDRSDSAADTAADSAADSAELLRRVVAHAGGGDRARLRAELTRARVPVGLGLAAITPGALRRLAADALGHAPRAEDLRGLVDATGAHLRELLPNLGPDAGRVLLGRACGVPPDGADLHPADSAVTGAVLTGLLMRRLGRGPDAVDRYVAPPEADHV